MLLYNFGMGIIVYFEPELFYFLLFLFFFLYGAIGVLPQKDNMLRILFMFELIILLISFMFLLESLVFNDIYGHIAVMYLLTIAAVEAAVGLALIYSFYRVYGGIKLNDLDKIKG